MALSAVSRKLQFASSAPLDSQPSRVTASPLFSGSNALQKASPAPVVYMRPQQSGWGERRLPWPSADAVPAESRAAWFERVPYQAHLDAISRSTAQSGNCTRLLIDGPASFMQKEAAIRDADVIFLKIYQFDDDAAGRRLALQLEHTARRGGRVFVQYGIKSFFNPLQLALIKLKLKDPTPPVLASLAKTPNALLVPNDRPTSWLKLVMARDHEKYLITWRGGEAVKLIMGGMNISDAWLQGGVAGAKTANNIQYRDTDVEIIGPTAKKAIKEFIADMVAYDKAALDPIWDANDYICETNPRVLYPPSAENAVVRFVRNKPDLGDRGQYIKKLYISLLQSVPAGESIRISNAYLLPRGPLKRAFIEAAERGVRLEMVINSPKSAEREGRILAKAAHSFFRTLLRRCKNPDNLRFYEFSGAPASGHNALHQKVASFGTHGPYIVGSSNLDEQSLHFNKEVCALIYDARGRRAFDAMWERDLRNGWRDPEGNPIVTTQRLTADFLRHEPRGSKIVQRTLYQLFSRIL